MWPECNCGKEINAKLDELLKYAKYAHALRVTVAPIHKKHLGENSMSPQKAIKAGLDVQILDSGAALYTFTPVDAAGQPTTLPAGTPPLSNLTSSDPNWSVALNTGQDPNVPADPTGMQLIGTPSLQPGAVLPITGIVVTAQTTFPGATSPATGTAPAIDLEGGAAAGLAVAVLSEPS